jgi:transposase InsO family protein
MDLVGLARVRSAGGKWYVLVVVDDYSWYAWVFFLEDKGETFGFVRDLFLRLRNKRHGDALRAIHSDNGSEFRNSCFETFCHDLGLEHQFSSLYMPPQNGVVERKNMTLCEMARTMLDELRTPRRFWAEVVNTACYVSEWFYLRVHKKKTCYELIHGRTPKVSHFYVFGCKCFILKKGNKLDKFEARSVDGILFGYASHSRAYRVLSLETNQIVETCEVTFNETQPRSQLVFECAGHDELGEEIFQEEEHELGDDEDGGVVPPAERVHTTSTTLVDDPSPTPMTTNQDRGEAVVEGEVASRREPPRRVQVDHPASRIMGNMNERTIRSRVSNNSHFAHAAFVATFEPKDIRHALSDHNWVNSMHEELENF